ncbi:uncharacterized protein [Montipora capricornis]|uniref:uncharacterized protein n=1 Tax=Montipora capricornis TaxID=246305 RepID=UPI0035F11A63
MSVTVTIHNGEMGQIKYLIEQKKTKGELYGLWTHSYQPVVQYVTGGVKQKDQEKIGKYLQNNHGLKQVGNWSTQNMGDVHPESDCLSFVTMTVTLPPSSKKIMNVERVCVSQNQKEFDGVMEILDGDSAFRLPKNGPFQGDDSLASYHHEKVDPIEVKSPLPSTNEVKVRGEQWYSTEKGMELFGKIHGAFKNRFTITGTSRNKDTHDISLAINTSNRGFSVDFQSDFPKGKAFLTSLQSGTKQEIKLLGQESNGGKAKRSKKHKKSTDSPDSSMNKGKPFEKQVAPANPEHTDKSDEDSQMQGVEEDNEDDEDKADQESLDFEKVPQLLVQGIQRLLKRESSV